MMRVRWHAHQACIWPFLLPWLTGDGVNYKFTIAVGAGAGAQMVTGEDSYSYPVLYHYFAICCGVISRQFHGVGVARFYSVVVVRIVSAFAVIACNGCLI